MRLLLSVAVIACSLGQPLYAQVQEGEFTPLDEIERVGPTDVVSTSSRSF